MSEIFSLDHSPESSSTTNESTEPFPIDSPVTGNLFFGGCDCRRAISTTPYSVVYQAYERNDLYKDEKYRRPVIVKVISLDENADSRAEERIERYSNELASFHLVKNPHTVRLLSVKYEKEKKQSVFVMEYIHGPTVENADTEHDLSMELVAQLFKQLCFILVDIHSKGVIHGDIHAANVMFYQPFPSETPVDKLFFFLLDFGLSSVGERGSPTRRKTPRNDVAGLACMIHLILLHQFINKPNRADVRLPALIQVLTEAQLEDGAYDTITKFENAFKDAMENGLLTAPSEAFFDTFEGVLENPTQIIERPRTRPRANMKATETAETLRVEQTNLRQLLVTIAAIVTVIFILTVLIWAVFNALIVANASSAPIPIAAAPRDGIVFGVLDGRVALMNRGKLVDNYPNLPASVFAISADGRYMAAERAVIDLWTGRTVMEFAHEAVPVAVALSPDGSILALHDGTTVRLMDVLGNRAMHTLTDITLDELNVLLTPAGRSVLRAALTQSRRRMAEAATH